MGVNFSTKTRAVSEWKIEKEGEEANKEPNSQQKQVAPEPAQQQEPDSMPTVYNAIQIARNLLAQGFEVGIVAQSTGLSIEAVQALAHQVNRAL